MRFTEHWLLKSENFLGVCGINQRIDIPHSPGSNFFRGMIIEQVQWLVALEDIFDSGNTWQAGS